MSIYKSIEELGITQVILISDKLAQYFYPKYNMKIMWGESGKYNINYNTFVCELYNIKEIIKHINNTNINWKILLCKNYNDNAGSGILTSIDNILPLNVFSQIHSSSIKFNCNLSYMPLINVSIKNKKEDEESENEENEGSENEESENEENENEESENEDKENNIPFIETENIIYNCTVNPFYPLLITTTIPNHKTFAPIFATNIEYTLNGMEGVNINISFEGSRRIKIFNINRENINESLYSLLENPMRSINIYDCACYISETNDYENFKWSLEEILANSYSQIDYKIIEMKLEITQSLEQNFTCIPNNTLQKELQGANFILMKKRDVKGSITLFSKSSKSPYIKDLNYKPLMLHFGNKFTFKLKSVIYNEPTATLNVSGGYIHIINFSSYIYIDNTQNDDNNNINTYSEFYIAEENKENE